MDDLYSMLENAESSHDYREILEQLRWAQGFCCYRCGSGEAYRCEPRQLMQCKGCGLQISATSGTVLHGVRDLRSWVEAILSMLDEDSRSTVSVAGIFHRGYVTAWFMMQKIRIVLGEFLRQPPEPVELCSGAVDLHCSVLDKALFKASSGDTQTIPDLSSPVSSTEIEAARWMIAFLLGTFNGVSRKYSQLYAFEYSLRRNRARIEPLALLSCFVRGSPTSREQVARYVSPYIIHLKN